MMLRASAVLEGHRLCDARSRHHGVELACECAVVLHRHGVSDKIRAASKGKGWPTGLDHGVPSARSVVELTRSRARLVELLTRRRRPGGASRLLASTRVPCAAPACVVARHGLRADHFLACVMRQRQADEGLAHLSAERRGAATSSVAPRARAPCDPIKSRLGLPTGNMHMHIYSSYAL